MKRTKRALSFLLCLAMMLGMVRIVSTRAEAASNLPTGWVARDGAVSTTLEGAYEEVVQLFKIFTAMNRDEDANNVSNITPYFTTTGYSCATGDHGSCADNKCEWRTIARKMANYGLITQELASRIEKSTVGSAYTCQGFANFVRFYIFHGINSFSEMQFIVKEIPVSNATDDTLITLFSQAKIGDYVYFTGHPVMFHSITSNGIKILDNNSRIRLDSNEASTIRFYELTWSNIRNMNNKNNKVSMTRPPESWLSHYNSTSSTTPTTSMSVDEYLNLASVNWGAHLAVAYPRNGGSITAWKLPWTNAINGVQDSSLKLGTVSGDLRIINVIENHAGNIWYEYETGTGTRGFVYSGDLMFRAKTQVNFDANGGSVSTTSIRVDKGYSYGTLPTATRSGYTFSGWYTAKSGGNKVTNTTIVTNASDHTLYAHWTQTATTAPYYTSVTHGSVTADNAVLSGTCLNPSRITLKTGGCYISTMPGAIDNGQKLTDNIPSSYQTATSLPCSYNIKNEYGITLQSGTKYYYVFYVTDASGNSYYSQEYSFTTSGTAPTVAVTSIFLDVAGVILDFDETCQVTATVYPTNATNKNLQWSSSNTSVATVSASGLITPKAEGTATITARATDGSGVFSTATVEVMCSHTFGTTTLPAVSPKCTQTGLTEGKKCNACGTITVAQTTVPSTGHSHTATVTPPTCTAGGYTTYTCHCGDSYVADYTNEAGHSWSEWSVGMEPTATTEGQKFRTCGSCGETEFDTIPSTGNTEPTTPSVVDSGTCGENLTWTLDSDGLLTISGTGEMVKSNGGLLYPQWYALRNSILSVVIEEGVTDIGDSAFYECENLSSITIPESVTKIGDYAFSSCYNLSSIALPENITSIGSNAFHFCESLTNIVLPESLISIGGTAFAACSGLSSITIPEGVIDIGDYAFYYCGNLTDIALPESITRIGDYAFSGCKNLSTVHYAGTEAQRADISIEAYNPDLEDAEWHYECDGVVCMNPETPPTEPKPSEPKPTEPKPTEPKPTTPPAEDDKPAKNPFVDVPSDAFYHDPVLWAVDNAVTNGLDATHFGPDAGCTRAHVVTFLWRAAGEPAPSSSYNPFTDVLPGAYYYDAVLWAVEKGITNGVSATAFAPDQTCTRGQIVTFLWRYQHSPSASGTTSFIDIPAGQYYSTAVAWAVANSITNGMGDGIFAPDATCTRGQIVTFLYRAMA